MGLCTYKVKLPGPAYFALFKTAFFANGWPVVAVVFFRTLAGVSYRVLFASEGPPSHVNGYLVLSHHVKRLLRWHYDQLLCKHPSFSNFYCPHFSLVTSPLKSELYPRFYIFGSNMICVEEMSLHRVSMCHRTLLPNIEALARNVSDRPLVRSRLRRNLMEEKNTNKHGESPPKINIYYLWSCRDICGRGRGSWNNRRELLSFLEAHRNVHLARPRTLISIFMIAVWSWPKSETKS